MLILDLFWTHSCSVNPSDHRPAMRLSLLLTALLSTASARLLKVCSTALAAALRRPALSACPACRSALRRRGMRGSDIMTVHPSVDAG